MSPLLAAFLKSCTPEQTFLGHLHDAIERARAANKHKRPARHQPMSQVSSRFTFRPLLLGYNGASNTGADVRVIEMLRQFRHIYAHVAFDPVLLASGADFGHAEFQHVRKLHMTSYFPDFIEEEMEHTTGIIACEGSMFTSTFSDNLTGMFAGGIGYATARGHLGVGYGAEAAAMSPGLEKFVASACDGSLVIARNKDSLIRLQQLGLRAQAGADPAWTFEPTGSGALDLLRQAGWNGQDRIAVLCPVNPFCWPVVIDVARGRGAASQGTSDEWQRDAISFHSWSAEAAQKYQTYLAGFAELIQSLRGRGYFTLLVGMQDIDQPSCLRLNQRLDAPLPVFVRGPHSIDDITGLLHHAALIVTSRFHAALIGMAAGTPCIGVSMDSRITTLFSENGLQDWLLDCDSTQLGSELVARASAIEAVSAQLTDQYGMLAAKNIRAFGQMGINLMAETTATYPDFPASPLGASWDAYLPPLSRRVEQLLSRHA